MRRGDVMYKNLLAGVAAIGLLAGAGTVSALATAGAPAAATSTAAVTSSTSKAPDCGPLAPLVAKGTITQSQAIAIHTGFVSYVRDHWPNILATVLGQQVKNHTITQAQARAVAGAITQEVQKYRGEQSGHHMPCQNGHGGNMMGRSGNR
jgi:hypothetical protein